MVKKYLKMTTTIAIVTILLIIPSIPSVASVVEGNQQKVSSFLQTVIGLETALYETKLISEMPTLESGGATMLYNLVSEDSTLELICNYRNNELVSCSINQIKGSVIIANPDKNILSAARTILDKYQTYSNAPYIQSLKTDVYSINELKNTTIKTQDTRFSVTLQDNDFQSFEWMNSPNGIYNMYNRISFIFQNGSLKSFTDAWNQYPVGDYKEVTSKEQAIAIAKANLDTYSYEFGNETITNLQLNEKSEWLIANLTMQPRNNVLYPHWEIVLPLDRVYPGFTYGFRVMIWGDSGEVISARATGSLGYPIDEDNSNAAASTSGTTIEATDANSSVAYIITGVFAAIIVVTAIALIKKNQYKK